ncbi:hypothetical protein, partial [Sabulibacter ruber]|uniref:hypothetical protein n=1 Tax=Sabulibacter ruber TaxID=2811901 RepID=UPI001A963435
MSPNCVILIVTFSEEVKSQSKVGLINRVIPKSTRYSSAPSSGAEAFLISPSISKGIFGKGIPDPFRARFKGVRSVLDLKKGLTDLELASLLSACCHWASV